MTEARCWASIWRYAPLARGFPYDNVAVAGMPVIIPRLLVHVRMICSCSVYTNLYIEDGIKQQAPVPSRIYWSYPHLWQLLTLVDDHLNLLTDLTGMIVQVGTLCENRRLWFLCASWHACWDPSTIGSSLDVSMENTPTTCWSLACHLPWVIRVGNAITINILQ